MWVRKLVGMLLVGAVLLGPAVSQAGIIIIVGKQGQPIVVDPQAFARLDAAAINGRGFMFGGAIDGDPLLLKQIQDGVVTPDEASSGCGGNASGGGSAGLPLAFAAMALLGARRRRS